MKIIWLEDEPETIEVIQDEITQYCSEIIICQSFLTFSEDIASLEDNGENIIIIDIKMIFNREIHFQCFNKTIKINNELDSGFEYFNHCLHGRFKNVKIIFFSSKPQKEAMEDAKRHNINSDIIISKEYTMELLEIIRGEQ